MANLLSTWMLYAALDKFSTFPDEELIATDRPDFTESSSVVPLGSTQLESGFTVIHDKGLRALSGPEVLLRHSLSERWEIRLGMPDHNWQASARGWDDLYVGSKVQLWPLPGGFGAALIPAITVPVGDRQFRSEAVSPEIKAVWSKELSGGRSLAGMLYVSLTEEDGRDLTVFQHTFTVGMPISGKLGVFVEHVLDFSRSSKPAHTLHAGLTIRPEPRKQFDVHVGVGLNREAPSWFIAGGYSVRF